MEELRNKIVHMLGEVAGEFAVAVRHVLTREEILINEKAVFPSASVIKVPIMVELFCRRDAGNLSLSETVLLRDADKIDGSGILKELHPGIEVTIEDLIVLMIVLSDNTATNLLIQQIGMESVNECISHMGLTGTVLARKMYDWQAVKEGRENTCTAGDMCDLLDLLARGRISSNSTSMEMVAIMARQQYTNRIPLLLPAETTVANKTGSLTGVTNDVGIVYGPTGPYAVSILLKGVSDIIGADGMIGKVSKIVYNHFCERAS